MAIKRGRPFRDLRVGVVVKRARGTRDDGRVQRGGQILLRARQPMFIGFFPPFDFVEKPRDNLICVGESVFPFKSCGFLPML